MRMPGPGADGSSLASSWGCSWSSEKGDLEMPPNGDCFSGQIPAHVLNLHFLLPAHSVGTMFVACRIYLWGHQSYGGLWESTSALAPGLSGRHGTRMIK